MEKKLEWLHIRVEPHKRAKLKKIASKHPNVTVSDLVRKAIDDLLNKSR